MSPNWNSLLIVRRKLKDWLLINLVGWCHGRFYYVPRTVVALTNVCIDDISDILAYLEDSDIELFYSENQHR